MTEEEIKTDHFKTMEELLKHLKMWEIDDDYDAYYRFFCPRCAYEMAHKIDRLQKELDKKDKVIEKLLYKKAQSVLYDCKEEEILKYKEELKQGYYKKVEEENVARN